MKNNKIILFIIFALALTLVLPTGCGAGGGQTAVTSGTSQSGDIFESTEENTSVSTVEVVDSGANNVTSEGISESVETSAGDSAGDGVTESSGNGADNVFVNSLDANGYFADVKALDYVEIFNYKAMPIPADVHQITETDVQNEIDAFLQDYGLVNNVTDRDVEDGDIVNIDYVGSIDGVEFDGGSTNGMGTDVTAGSTDYIGDFLSQIIGHMPGETVDVNVTFPDDYPAEELQGKDALFVTTINYIAEDAELTDAFVAENLLFEYGWTTINDMKVDMRNSLVRNSITAYIEDYFTNEVVIKSVPEGLVEYQKNGILSSYRRYAEMYNMELDDFLNTYVGFSDTEEFVQSNAENILNAAKYYLVIQAVAEDANILVDEEDLAKFFSEQAGTSDYSVYEEEYGLPYLKQMALNWKVVGYIIDNCVQL